MIIMQVSVQIGLNWNWPTGTELGNISGIKRQLDEIIDPITYDIAKLRCVLPWKHVISLFDFSYNGVT